MVNRMAQMQDPEQLTGEVLRLGTIASVDHANATCTVKSGDIVTGELPWVAQRAGRIRHWCPPTEGEQCLLLCPEGAIENGLVIVWLYSDACPADRKHVVSGKIVSVRVGLGGRQTLTKKPLKKNPNKC